MRITNLLHILEIHGINYFAMKIPKLYFDTSISRFEFHGLQPVGEWPFARRASSETRADLPSATDFSPWVSTFNFALAEDVPVEREITLKLLDEVKNGKYEVFISEVVLREINRAPQAKAVKLRDCIKKVNPEELILDENVFALAKEYIEKGVIPPKYEDDALHIAVASVSNLDVIVSWNFTHIVKLKTKREVAGINTFLGYKPIEICSPQEVIVNV